MSGMNGCRTTIRFDPLYFDFKQAGETEKGELVGSPSENLLEKGDYPPISVRPVSWAPSSMEKTLDLMSPLIFDLSFNSQRWEVILPSTFP